MEERQRKDTFQKPRWLKKRLPSGPGCEKMRALMASSGLHTVCQEAKCPNIWECFSSGTATFLILGDHCTRDCRFCAVAHGPEGPPDPGEPKRVAEAVKTMGLRYVVVTSVTRDDLPDGGAGLFAETIEQIRQAVPDTLVEVLIPDFQGERDALIAVLEAHPAVLNHNIETAKRLYPRVRPQADYDRSLQLLKRAREYQSGIPVKSGLMLGLGEAPEEIRQTLEDLVRSGCTLLTLGQYLQPSASHLPVKRFVPPEEFEQWRETALQMGFAQVASGPFVRSSYHAKELYQAASSGGA